MAAVQAPLDSALNLLESGLTTHDYHSLPMPAVAGCRALCKREGFDL